MNPAPKIKTGYSCVVEDAPSPPDNSHAAFIRRIPNPGSYFKNDGERAPMVAAIKRHVQTSTLQVAKLK
jgi:hypothetical protein